jgi:predicted permease
MLQLDSLLAIFASTLLPVALVAAAGYVLASFVPLDGRTLGRFLFFLATPSLVFRSLYRMTLDLTALQHVAAITIGVLVAGAGLGALAAYGQSRRRRAGLILASAIGNNGNMGIPICLFAFGEAGVALATVYYAITSFLSNTLGVVIASAGSSTLLRAAGHSLQSPVLYAAVLGLIFNRVGVTIPESVFSAINLLAGAAVPGMLVLLGAQLRSTHLGGDQRIIWRSVLIRLVASPLVAWALCSLIGIGGLERQVLIVQAAMPTAVMSTVLATEFDAAPRLVAATVLVTTLLSMFTLSVVLSLVM